MPDSVTDTVTEMETSARHEVMTRVWDPVVRLFHWSLVTGFVVAYYTRHRSEAIHDWAGYAALGLVVLRILWGVIGTRHARFTDFVKRPSTIFAYLRDIARGGEARHLGHNPAGGAMIVALMLAVLATGLTGWLQYTDAFYGDDRMVLLHSLAAHGMLLLVLVHLGGVAVASLRHRENLVFAMITGRKRAPAPEDVD